MLPLKPLLFAKKTGSQRVKKKFDSFGKILVIKDYIFFLDHQLFYEQLKRNVLICSARKLIMIDIMMRRTASLTSHE